MNFPGHFLSILQNVDAKDMTTASISRDVLHVANFCYVRNHFASMRVFKWALSTVRWPDWRHQRGFPRQNHAIRFTLYAGEAHNESLYNLH